MGHFQGCLETQGMLVLQDPMLVPASDLMGLQRGHLASRAAQHWG